MYTYVENNPLKYIDPSGHFKLFNFDFNMSNERMQSLIVEARMDNGNARYWALRSSLGTMYKDIIRDQNNNQFQFLFDVASMQSPYKELNNLDNAVWAGEELLGIWDAYKRNITVEVIASFATRGMARNLKFMCNCFSAGTKVITDEGEKNIEDIEVGDKVLSKNEETGEQDYKEVTALHRNEKDTTYKLSVGNQIIETTDNHPFWVEGKG